MSNQPGTQTKLIYEKMFFADNRLGVTLRYAHETDENTCIFRESYISGISRISCPTCYGAGKIEYYTGGYAVRMFAAITTGESFQLLKILLTMMLYALKNLSKNSFLGFESLLRKCKAKRSRKLLDQ